MSNERGGRSFGTWGRGVKSSTKKARFSRVEGGNKGREKMLQVKEGKPTRGARGELRCMPVPSSTQP